MYDFLIVGAGLFGSVFAHNARLAGKKCLVIDKRKHIGGNCYTSNSGGISVHQYGPHIFHTNSDRVWKFVNQFAFFRQFVYSPVANFKGNLYSLPFNMWTFHQLWGVSTPEEAIQKIKETRVEFSSPKNLEEYALNVVGSDVYETLIKHYTTKHWLKNPSELPVSIIKRLPFRLTYDSRYYNDKYCAIPTGGYTQIFEKLLTGIAVETDVDYFSNRAELEKKCKKIIYTGCLDQFYDYIHGELEYRTLKFEHKKMDVENFQGVPVINYTSNDVPYTRTIEHKHFDPVKTKHTIVTTETPIQWDKGKTPYYPISTKENKSILNLYNKEIEKEKNVFFGGRLAKYQYYDMDQVIASSLLAADNILTNRRNL